MAHRVHIIESPVLTDPLADIVSFLQPRAPYSKWVTGAGPWRIRRDQTGQVFYALVLEGAIRFQADGRDEVELAQGDFVLVPSSFGFTTTSATERPEAGIVTTPVHLGNGALRVGRAEGPADCQYLVGHCVFGSPDAALLFALLLAPRSRPRCTPATSSAPAELADGSVSAAFGPSAETYRGFAQLHENPCLTSTAGVFGTPSRPSLTAL